MNSLSVDTGSESETEALGARVALSLPSVRLIYIGGPLGAGKTTLVRGLLYALGHTGAVKSPTFTLVEPYTLATGGALYHFDLYRLNDPEELEFIGIRDYLSGSNVCIVEWPERAGGILPAPDLDIMIEPNHKHGRKLTLHAHSSAGVAALSGWR